MSRLQTHYKETLIPQLMGKLELKNIMEVPKITKVTLNMGVGEAVTDKKVMAHATGDMDSNSRPEADCYQCTQISGYIQNS